MKYTKLGNTDIKVSKICVGGMSFGEVKEGGHQWTLDQKLTQEMLAKALELGVNFIPAGNEPSSHACTDIWRMPRGVLCASGGLSSTDRSEA